MNGFIDLHCHWIAGVDDGAKTVEQSAALLQGLRRAGFDTVVATPHMRPGMFDNDATRLRTAYAATRDALGAHGDLPQLDLSSEHYFDDVVFDRMLRGEALPYPGGHGILVEFPNHALPTHVTHRFFDLMRRRVRPVVAHPERYEPVWRDPTCLDPLLDGGAVLLLDVAALSGKYGRAPRKAAERLLADNYYFAACSDAHKAADVDDVRRGIDVLRQDYGDDEVTALLVTGPRQILDGTVED